MAGDHGWLMIRSVLNIIMLINCLMCFHLQVAGYVTEYDTNGFQFVTVKGSGHMVLEWIYMYGAATIIAILLL